MSVDALLARQFAQGLEAPVCNVLDMARIDATPTALLGSLQPFLRLVQNA